MLRVGIDPFKVLVRSEFFHDMDREFNGQFTKCEVVAVTSYPGHALTFDVVTDTGAFFSYVPIHALCSERIPFVSLSDVCYHDCRDEHVAVSKVDVLVNRRVTVFDRTHEAIGAGDYVLTIDWYRQNDLLHVIKMAAGHFIAWPSHKLLWGKVPQELPKFDRMRQEWRVGK